MAENNNGKRFGRRAGSAAIWYVGAVLLLIFGNRLGLTAETIIDFIKISASVLIAVVMGLSATDAVYRWRNGGSRYRRPLTREPDFVRRDNADTETEGQREEV